MSDFLQFLNTADAEALTKLPGVNSSLADRIISARPFDALESALKVRGLGKNLFARMQAAFAELPPPIPEEVPALEITREEKPAEDKPSELPERIKSMSAEKPSTPQPGFWSRLGRAFVNFLWMLLRVFVILSILAAIGAAVFFGAPYLNEKFVVPVEKNTARIDEVAAQQAEAVNRLNEEITALQTRLDETNGRVGALEESIAAHTATLTKLEAMQATLDQASAKQRDIFIIELKHQIMITRAIEMLARGRLYLSQSNFGLAKTDVQSARDVLSALHAEAPAYQLDALDAIIARLDLALGNLPDFPVIAVDDVDIAWQLLMQGLPESAPAP
jgi:hypothetical protein